MKVHKFSVLEESQSVIDDRTDAETVYLGPTEECKFVDFGIEIGTVAFALVAQEDQLLVQSFELKLRA